MSDETEMPEDDTVIDLGDHKPEKAGDDAAADMAVDETELGEEPGAGPLSLENQVVALEAEKLEIKDQLLRTLAEMDNVRKRAERRVADERVYAIEKFARDLLGVADNLSRALTAVPVEARLDLSDAGKGLLDGIELTEKELIAAMARHGVTIIDAMVGTEFDPNVHQAVAQIPSEQAEGTIAEPFQTGWKIGDRTLRAAMVAVSTGPQSE